MPKSARFRHFLHIRTRIRDGNEVFAGLGSAHNLGYALVEIFLEDVRLERAARLTRYDKNRLREIDLRFNRLYLRRIGRIEGRHFRITTNLAERKLQNLNAKARTAHTQQHSVRESRGANLFGNLLETLSFRQLLFDNSQPAEPLALVGIGPERGIRRP